MEGKVDKNSDVISVLPVPILHQILSFLPCKESARTSVLCKQWNFVRKSFPILEFWLPTDMKNMPVEAPQFKERLGEFLDFVDRSLQHFVHNKLCIKKLRLNVSRIDSDSVSLVNTWLPLALHSGVLLLFFHVNVCSEGDDYSISNYPLPETTFAINSSRLSGFSEFFRLEMLMLVSVYLSEDIVRDIIRNCPNISHLCLWDICGLETLNISRPNKLVSFTVTLARFCREFKSIYVDALSLDLFSFSFCENNLPCAIDLTSCCNLRKIMLCNSIITDAQLHMHISKFPLLEVLNISYCHRLQKIRTSLHRLKHLRLHRCAGIRAIKIDAPILASFDFAPIGVNLPLTFSSKAIPCPVYLLYERNVSHDQISSWFLQLREYPDVPFKGVHFYPCSDGIKLSFDNGKSREAITPPLIEVDCLDLDGLRTIASFQWVTLLDGLLSSCHPKMVSITADSGDEDNCVKFLCELLVSECQLCCNLPHCKSWRHRLKAAKIESINGIKSDIEIVGDYLSIPRDKEVRFRLDWDLSAMKGIRHSLESFSID